MLEIGHVLLGCVNRPLFLLGKCPTDTIVEKMHEKGQVVGQKQQYKELIISYIRLLPYQHATQSRGGYMLEVFNDEERDCNLKISGILKDHAAYA